jgi:hypothetical protein
MNKKSSSKNMITRQAASFAWSAFKEHFGLFMGILLTFVAAWIILEIAVIKGQRFGIVWWSAAHLIFLVFFAGMQVGFIQACLDLYDGKTPKFIDIFRSLNRGLNFLIGQMLYWLITAGGLVLLILPGIYFGVRYIFLGFCQVENQEGLRESLGHSAIRSRGNIAYLLAVTLSLLLLNILGACLLGIGLFVTIPFSSLMMAAIHRQLLN